MPLPQKVPNSTAPRDAGIVILSAVIVFVISHQFDLVEKLINFTERYEQWELDELLIVTIFLTLAIPFYLSRRWREVNKTHEELQQAHTDLQKAVQEIKVLRGFIPICANCKRIRDDSGYWEQMEAYISRHSEAVFSHGICPDCMQELYSEYYPDEATPVEE